MALIDCRYCNESNCEGCSIYTFEKILYSGNLETLKVVCSGNCIVCGRKLDGKRLFVCRECQAAMETVKVGKNEID